MRTRARMSLAVLSGIRIGQPFDRLNVGAFSRTSTMPILSASFSRVNCAIARIELQARTPIYPTLVVMIDADLRSENGVALEMESKPVQVHASFTNFESDSILRKLTFTGPAGQTNGALYDSQAVKPAD